MFNNIISYLSTYSIIIAAVLGVIRFKEIEKSYYPFIYICWLAVIFEILAAVFQTAMSTLWPSNIYVLLEGLLYVWQFKKWGSFRRRPYLYYVVLVMIGGLWLTDIIILKSLHKLSSYYRIGFSMILVILAIDLINKLIVNERKKFLTNAKFLICIGVVIYFSYKMVIETFFLYLKATESPFVKNLFDILTYINLFTNLLFGYLVLWIPRKKSFLKPLQ